MRLLANLTLQKRISLLVLISLMLGLGLFSWLGVQSLNESTQRTLDERLTVSRIVASHLDETLNHVLLRVQEAASFQGELPQEEQFRLRARALGIMLDKATIVTESVFLLGGDGRILQAEPPRPGAIGTMLPGYADVESRLSSGLPTISSLTYAPLTAAPVVFAIAPIMDAAGSKNIGALSVAIDVNESSISGFIKPITLGSTGYTEIVDKNGVVLARTEPGRPPVAFERSDHPGRFAQLMVEGKATVRTCHRCHGPESQPQRRRDVLAFAPLSAAPWGVAVRQAEEEAFDITEGLKRRLMIFGGIVILGVFLLVWLVMQGVVRPIRMLTLASARVAAGDFKAVVPISRRDEIGRLSTAFSVMTRELAKAQNEIVSRNQELLALNSIAATVGQSLELEDVLGKAMRQVLEVTRTEAGSMFLVDIASKGLKLVSYIGHSRLFYCPQSISAAADCACHRVLRLGHSLMVNDVSQCPALTEEMTSGTHITCFVSVPLKSKDKVLGVMNVACPSERCFTEDDFRLLDSIGYHIGLAIENSTLYKETRQEKELRGQLLNAIITAQEEERERISRDLHDGCGQTLTGLIMSIESAESIASSASLPLREKLVNTRLIALHVLQDMRKLMRGLRSSVLGDLGLAAAVRSYAETTLETAGVRLDFDAEGLNQRLATSVEIALFRIVQEALHNVVKHAQARTAKIRLRQVDSRIMVAVEDDGLGFDVAAFFSAGTVVQSLGLLGMRERATLLGGTFSVTSAPGKGTRVAVEVPLDISPDSKETPDERQDASADSR